MKDMHFEDTNNMNASEKKQPLAVQIWKNMSYVIARNIGYSEGLQDSFLRIAEVRFPQISKSLKDKIRSINAPEILNDLLDAAVQHKGDLAAFERTVDATLQLANAK
ncbi:MAG: hypothetical protein LBR22_10100 [Desulfovibrio sp.]|jgi:hypothetical protein|nr:hypothetical protein [Desulfovibrio sp.]